ncbi:type I-E CRISPR-associated protein Cse2/CasB [Streptomyces sp. NPDC014748]|uniref:type I-E CRISPR-associated protein Cse2/CasB n=1 Tax=Streptomyces sp. NPDC014748 TaxID=3364905 RepID=UPI0037006801
MASHVPVSTDADGSGSGSGSGGRTSTDPNRPLPGIAVSRVIGRLQSGYRRDVPWAVASVARLRREAGREAHVSPTAWGLEHLETLAELREERREIEREADLGRGAQPAYLTSTSYVRREEQERREDTAVHLAVTLWALHQQSLRDESMHRPGWPLGRAVRRLAHKGSGGREDRRPEGGTAASDGGPAPDGAAEQGAGPVEEADESVRLRFVRVGSASDTEVLATRLRELVLLLRSAQIPLDYALLADQLLRWQDENLREDVRRAWGRDFHRRYRATRHDDGRSAAAAGSPEPPGSGIDAEEADGDS